MVAIVGKYQHESDESFLEYLEAMKTPREALNILYESKPVIEISEAEGKWTVKISNAGKESVVMFTLGRAYDEPMPNGLCFKSITKRDEDTFVTESDLPDGNTAIRIYEFSEYGVILRLSDPKSGTKASRYYRRIE